MKQKLKRILALAAALITVITACLLPTVAVEVSDGEYAAAWGDMFELCWTFDNGYYANTYWSTETSTIAFAEPDGMPGIHLKMQSTGNAPVAYTGATIKFEWVGFDGVFTDDAERGYCDKAYLAIYMDDTLVVYLDLCKRETNSLYADSYVLLFDAYGGYTELSLSDLGETKIWLYSSWEYLSVMDIHSSFSSGYNSIVAFRYLLGSSTQTYPGITQGGYDTGYAAGKKDGYDAGYDVGYEEGYDEGLALGSDTVFDSYQNGYNEGYIVGYDEGYRAGDIAGYDRGYGVGKTDGHEEGYQEGYIFGQDDGYREGDLEGYNRGWITGKDVGRTDALNSTSALKNTIYAIFDAPSTLIGSMLDFDLFGINLFSLCKTVLTLAVVALIVFWLFKLIKG